MIRTEWQADAETFGYDHRATITAQLEARVRGSEFQVKQWCRALGEANTIKDRGQRSYYQAAAMRQINYYRKQLRVHRAQLAGVVH